MHSNIHNRHAETGHACAKVHHTAAVSQGSTCYWHEMHTVTHSAKIACYILQRCKSIDGRCGNDVDHLELMSHAIEKW